MTTHRRFGSIRKLPSGRWQATYSAPDGKRVKAPHTFAAKLDAEAWLVDRRREMDRGLWNPARTRHRNAPGSTSTRPAGWPTADLQTQNPRGLRNGSSTHHLLPTFGDMQLAAISPSDVRDWHFDTAAGQARHAGTRPTAVLRAILSHRTGRRTDHRQPVPHPRRRPNPAGATRSGPPPSPNSTRSPPRCPTG